MSEIELLCAGNALVDVFAEVSGDTLRNIRERFGLAKPVQHVSAETAAAILEALPQAATAAAAAGGGTANTAKSAAMLGVKTAFAGCTGAGPGGASDAFGALFERELSAAGVQTLLRIVHKPTGVFINLTAGGEKTIAASPSAALELGAEDLRGFPPEGADGAGGRPKILMFEGFLMDRPALVERCLQTAEQCGAVLAFDPGTAEIAARYAADILGWRAGSGRRFVLFANEAEAEALAAYGSPPAGPAGGDSAPGWKTLFSRLSAKTLGLLVAVKLAERGAVVFAEGEQYRAAARPAAGAESTGAGDAFAAGFLAALLRGEGPAACGAAGNAAAYAVLRIT